MAKWNEMDKIVIFGHARNSWLAIVAPTSPQSRKENHFRLRPIQNSWHSIITTAGRSAAAEIETRRTANAKLFQKWPNRCLSSESNRILCSSERSYQREISAAATIISLRWKWHENLSLPKHRAATGDSCREYINRARAAEVRAERNNGQTKYAAYTKWVQWSIEAHLKSHTNETIKECVGNLNRLRIIYCHNNSC